MINVKSEIRKNIKNVYTKNICTKYLFGLVKRHKNVTIDDPYSIGDVLLEVDSKLRIGFIYVDEKGTSWQAVGAYTLRNVHSMFKGFYSTPKFILFQFGTFMEGY